MLTRHGFKAETLETAGNPLVYGEMTVPGATGTVLVYAHYDGQPVDPKNWKQPNPFVPILRDGRLEDGAHELPGPVDRAPVRTRLAPLRALVVRRQVARSWLCAPRWTRSRPPAARRRRTFTWSSTARRRQARPA